MQTDELLEILTQNVVESAPQLLGATLIRGSMTARIVEVEAYRSDDPACHAFQKRTPRTEVMFGPPGVAYMYFNYGVHWMLNIVAHPPGDPAALLIRAAVPLEGLDQMRENRQVKSEMELLSGPGKLAKAYGLDGSFNGMNLLDEDSELRIVPPAAPTRNVLQGPRIGIAKGKWEDVPWRFVDGDSLAWVSRRSI